MKEYSIFNTPLELGLRSLYLLKAFYPSICSINKLLYLDYLTIYTRDSNVSPDSLHPDYPLRAIELYVKRKALKDGLLLMASKGLINAECNENGIFYSANSNTNWFLKGLSGEYSRNLSVKTNLIADAFKELSDSEVKEFINKNIEKWGNEFDYFYPLTEEVL